MVRVNENRRLFRRFITIGLVGCAIYAALPRSVGAQVLFVALAIAAPAAGIVAARRDCSSERSARWLLTVGFGLTAVGEIADLLFVTLSAHPRAGPTIDVVFLTAYIVELFGLMSLFRSQTASRHQYGWFDAVAVGLVVLTVVWTSMYEAIFGRARATPLDWVTRFGGAVLGVALAVMALRLVLNKRGRDLALNLLLFAFGLQVTADSIAALARGYATGARSDTLWTIAYVCMGGALLHKGPAPHMQRPPTRLAHVEIKHTLVLQAAVTIGLAALVVVEVGGVVPTVTLAVWACAWVAILVITRIRVFALLRLVGHASATENQLRLSAMLAGSSDVIGLADPDGTIRYLTPSIAALTGIDVHEWIGQRLDTMLASHLTGLDDVVARWATLGPGQSMTWEADVVESGSNPARTVQLTLVNQTDTPEVNGWVITAHDVTDQSRLTAELRHRSLHDTLTGLPNRGLLFDRIEHSISRMQRTPDSCISVVLVDIDDFKAVNDSLGHDVGDELLRAVAERLTRSLRQGDTVARLGGDEFALLLEDTDAAEALVLATRALENLALPVPIATGAFAVRASAGVVCQRGAADPVGLLRAADIAMYASKRDGKSRVTLFHDDMHRAAHHHLELRMDLASALDRNEFTVVYQPIVDSNTRCIRGAEALLRWNHPRHGTVSPAEFIPIAEQTGEINAIGTWVLRTACAEAAGWTSAGSNAYVSVNVSAPQLRDHHFVDLVIATLATTRLPADRLMLEITESMLIDDSEHARTILTRLRDVGVKIAIDDFGTGYSSLAYLRSLCVDVVKIDQTFVRDVDHNTDHQALTQTILALATGLGMTAIAEGVETNNEFDELIRRGCALVQGYLFSRPINPEALHCLFTDATTPPEQWDLPIRGAAGLDLTR